MSSFAPITREIFSHATKRAADIALVVGHKIWSWAALASDIERRAVSFKDADSLAPTFSAPDGDTSESVLNGLARLHLGFAIIGATSGSTASAKRYKRSQDSWIASFAAQEREFAVHASDVVIAPGSLAHSLFSYALCQGLFVGAKVVLSESFRPNKVLQQIHEHRGSVLYAVPTQLKLIEQTGSEVTPPIDVITDHATSDPASLATSMRSLRLLLSSGARWFGEITPGLKHLFPGAEIVEFYGASETSFVSLARHTTDSHLPNGSLGKVFSGVDVKIEEEGLIFVHSRGLFDGYLGEPPNDFCEHRNANGDRWISVGDLGCVDGNGYLFLSGRQSRKIVTSGKNLYPEEVEQCLSMHPAIEHAAVFGLADELRGERLIAAVAIKTGCEMPSQAECMAFFRPMLEDFKIPRDFVAIDPWPMTPAGKTDFAELKRALENRR